MNRKSLPRRSMLGIHRLLAWLLRCKWITPSNVLPLNKNTKPSTEVVAWWKIFELSSVISGRQKDFKSVVNGFNMFYGFSVLGEENETSVKKIHFQKKSAGMLFSKPGEKLNSNHSRVILFCHGGGYCSGTSTAYRHVGECLVKNLSGNTHVLIVDYRKVPKYSIIDATEDLLVGWEWLVQDQGIQSEQICLVGDSAGGGLVLHLAHMIKKRLNANPSSLVLICPWVDISNSSESHDVNNDITFPSRFTMDSCREEILLISKKTDYKDPEMSSLFLSMDHLPPMYVCWSKHERLSDDGRNLVKKAKQQNIEVAFEESEYGVHNYPLLPGAPEFKTSFLKICQFIETHFEVPFQSGS